MKKALLVIILFSCVTGIAQFYSVSIYEKIAGDLGGFTAIIDDEDWFGYSVEAIGDLDGDGINDVVVGALKDDDGGFNRGAIYVLFLNDEGQVQSYQKISDTEGGFDGVLDDWDIFGSSISYLGDINNDGFVEIAVGAEYDGDGGLWHGAVWILSLASTGAVVSYVKISDTEGNFMADLGDEDVFGTDVELLGDLNGDGNQDIAVSARRDPDGGSDRGAVYILFLNADLTVNDYQKISDTQGGFEGVLEEQDYFGGSVANIGDLNGDGVIDLAVGAYRDDDGGLNRGAVYILFMNADGTVEDYQKISDTEGNFNAEFNDEMFFGISVDLSRDINGDGLTEIVVGARGYENQEGPNFGTFFILNLNIDGTVASYVQYTEGLNHFNGDISPGDSFGFSVSYIGALTEMDSFVVGAFSDDEGGVEKGSVWVLQLGEVLSIEEIDENLGISLFPNPTRNSFSLDRVDGISSIKVYDLYGRLVVKFSDVSDNLFNVSYLPVGEYIIVAAGTEGNLSSFKLIKK